MELPDHSRAFLLKNRIYRCLFLPSCRMLNQISLVKFMTFMEFTTIMMNVSPKQSFRRACCFMFFFYFFFYIFMVYCFSRFLRYSYLFSLLFSGVFCCCWNVSVFSEDHKNLLDCLDYCESTRKSATSKAKS